MVMEFSVGRASKVSAALSFDRLEPKERNGIGISMELWPETIC